MTQVEQKYSEVETFHPVPNWVQNTRFGVRQSAIGELPLMIYEQEYLVI